MSRPLTITALLIPVDGSPEVRTVAVDPAAYEDALGGAYTRAAAGAGVVAYAGSPPLPGLGSGHESGNLTAATILDRHEVPYDMADLTGPVLITGAPDEDGWDTNLPWSWSHESAARTAGLR